MNQADQFRLAATERLIAIARHSLKDDTSSDLEGFVEVHRDLGELIEVWQQIAEAKTIRDIFKSLRGYFEPEIAYDMLCEFLDVDISNSLQDTNKMLKPFGIRMTQIEFDSIGGPMAIA
jgi:hypothetical protein